jgi:hypothetical protein
VDFDLDPAVADEIKKAQGRQADARRPRKEREKKAKEQRKARSRLPRRISLDLPTDIKAQVGAVAEAHRVPVSQVVAVLLAYGLASLDKGALDLSAYKVPSASPRYDWNLSLEKLKRTP